MSYPRYPNQGQHIALGWNNAPLLKAITELVGTDGERFIAVNDRGLYSPGVIRQLPTGGILYSGMPTVHFISPWITDGQIETLKTYSGNVTIRHHIDDSLNKGDVQTSNAIFNLDLNQLAGLERVENTYKAFRWDFVIVEVI